MRKPDFTSAGLSNSKARTSLLVPVLILSLIFTATLPLAACDNATPEESAETAMRPEDGTIKAEPNPVPAGEGMGRTKISWSAKAGLPDVEVHVSENGQPEAVFAQAASGEVEAPWIQAGNSYEFRLYAGSGRQRYLINKVQVTRAP